MKVAYVVPRYGPEILGGAETGARMLAEHLVAGRGDEVEVFTTCATDALTWVDELAPGTERLNGVKVHRLASAAGRDPSFHPYSGALLAAPEAATAAEAERWIDLQGPVCPDLVEAVAATDADVVAFYPYLYFPTVRGVPRVADRAVLHPAAHDEPPLHLPVFRDVFRSVRGLVFQTKSEQRLVETLFGVATTQQVVVGLGVEEAPGSPDDARAAVATWATRRISSAWGGWTTRRGPGCSGGTSAPTSSATPGPYAWCSWARWWTGPSPPPTWWSPVPSATGSSGDCSGAQRPWCRPRRGRRSRSWSSRR